jgi:hypothetical protein
MGEIEIKTNEWGYFLENFSRQHENWLISIEMTDGKNETKKIVDNIPLKSISLKESGDIEISYMMSNQSDNPEGFTVEEPRRIQFERTEDGRHKALHIGTEGNMETTVTFRTAVSPEVVDGIIGH